MLTSSPRPRRIASATLVAALALSLALAGTAAARQIIRAVDGNHFQPKSPSVSTGERVIWKNADNIDHTVTSWGGGWSKDVRLNPDERTTFTFNQSGTYKFRCKIIGHSNVSNGRCSGMCGKVVVG